MRDTQAFDVELFVDGKTRAKIGIEQAPVDFSKSFKRERPAVFLDFMDLFFKFGKHRLAKQGLPDILDLAINEVRAHLCVISPFQKMVGKKLFGEGRGDFSQENWITVILEKLMLLSVPAMH